MAKALSVVATVAAIALAIPSGGTSLLAKGVAAAGLKISATALTIGVVALNIGAQLLAKPPKLESSGGSQTEWKSDPDAAIPIVFGRTLVGGSIIHREAYGKDNKYQAIVTVLSGCGPVEAIDQRIVDSKVIAYDGTNPTGSLRNLVKQGLQLGAAPTTVPLYFDSDNVPREWGTGKLLSGLAASCARLTYKDEELVQEPKLQWLGRWVKCYDPRKDSTFPGGSGPQRVGNQATWTFSENPWIQCLTFAIGWRHGPKNIRVGGVGMPLAGIDMQSFVEAANIADLNGWKSGGQASTADNKWEVMKALAQAGGGEPVRHGAVLSAMVNAPRVPIALITRDDLIGEASVTPAQPRRDRLNGIVPKYRSEDHDWEVVPASVVRHAGFLAEDGEERTRERDYPMVQCVAGADPDQATHLAAYDIVNAREANPIVLPLKLHWMGFKAGDCLTVEDVPEFGWLAGRDVIVIKRQIDPATGGVTLTLRSENPAKHDWVFGLTGSAPPTLEAMSDKTLDPPLVSEWSLAAELLTDGEARNPALVVERVAGDDEEAETAASLIRVETWRSDGVTAPGDIAVWDDGGVVPGTSERWVTTSVVPGANYYVRVTYLGNGIKSDPLILGPVQAGFPTLLFPDGRPIVELRGRRFWPTLERPTLSESDPGDLWADPDDGTLYVHKRQSVVIGAKRLVIGGKRPMFAFWEPAANQSYRDALGELEEALADLAHLADDGVLSKSEKLETLIPERAELNGRYLVLLETAAELDIATTEADAAKDAWDAYLDGLSPAWNDITQPTPVVRETYRGLRKALKDQLEILTQAIAARGLFMEGDALPATVAAEGVYFWLNPPGELWQSRDGEWVGPLADVTDNTVSMVEPAAKTFTFQADYTGALLAGQVPHLFQFRRYKGNVDVTDATTWMIIDSEAIVSATIANGLLTINDCTQEGSITIRSVHQGVEIDTQCDLLRPEGPPPQSGGGGAQTVFDNALLTIDGTAHVPASKVMTVRTGSAGVITFTAPLTFGGAIGNGVYRCYAKWVWRPVGGSFADVAAEVAHSKAATFYLNGGGARGTINVGAEKSSLSPNTDYEVQLMMREHPSNPGGGFTFVYPFGTATAVGS